MSEPTRLRIAIERLSNAATPHYAIWVVEAPYPGGYVHHDRPWTSELNQLWQSWLELFSLRGAAAGAPRARLLRAATAHPRADQIPRWLPAGIFRSIDANPGRTAVAVVI